MRGVERRERTRRMLSWKGGTTAQSNVIAPIQGLYSFMLFYNVTCRKEPLRLGISESHQFTDAALTSFWSLKLEVADVSGWWLGHVQSFIRTFLVLRQADKLRGLI
jgi:hypothetical protein